MVLASHYQPQSFESKWYHQWQNSGSFAPTGDGAPYTIIMPPPNVTGTLHLGHALNGTIQDILIRFERMRGRRALWQPGFDHAGIATQNLVERKLEQEGSSREQLGRDEFIGRVWAWKEQSAERIREQFDALGASCDWNRLAFTLDPTINSAVVRVFCQLYQEGLIYRDKRLVNWDPKLRTAISDLEIKSEQKAGSMWHIRYPLVNPVLDGIESIVIATTRPETLFGDTAIAVHPDDTRYQALINQRCKLPLTTRTIPVVADSRVDPEHGTGCVKITPAHDFLDFEIGRTHQLESINILDDGGCLNEHTLPSLVGKKSQDARKDVVDMLENNGFMEKIVSMSHMVPHGDRSGSVVEPRLSDQWFVNAHSLAGPAIKAVEDGDVRFFPHSWSKTYFEWMRNIEPWCISRQLWWGHRIPAWYGPDHKIFVAPDEQQAQQQAQHHYGEKVSLTQDPDVLDTWFSSALWPFTTMGWPEKTPAMDDHFPSDVLLTGFDIIFFWVARMMMMSHHFTGKSPFKTVYVHPLVRDADGKKMSKSKGNALDPQELFTQYGTDAVRFTFASLTVPGRNIRLSHEQLTGPRNFVTKLWNMCRFAQMNGVTLPSSHKEHPVAPELALNRWLEKRIAITTHSVTHHLEEFRFDQACMTIYQFVWNELCDWYVELAKPILTNPHHPHRLEVCASLGYVIGQTLRLLHPFIPFVTEELWYHLSTEQNDASNSVTQHVITMPWPTHDPQRSGWNDDLAWVRDSVAKIRSLRTALKISPKDSWQTAIFTQEDRISTYQSTLYPLTDAVFRMARLTHMSIHMHDDPNSPQWIVRVPMTNGDILAIKGLEIMADTHLVTVRDQIKSTRVELQRIEQRLNNPQFQQKAEASTIEETKKAVKQQTTVLSNLQQMETMLLKKA